MIDQHEPDDHALRAAAWRSGRLEWMLHEGQQLIHNQIEELPPEIKELVILCCRRFGKSFYLCIRALMKCLRYDGFVYRIIGPEVKQTRGIVRYNMSKITQELPALGLRDLVRWVGYDNMYWIGDQGSALFLGGYDSQEDNQRGGEAHEIGVEETGSSDPEQYAYQMRDVLKPQTLKTRGRMIHATTLPPVPDHPFTEETIPQAQLEKAFYSFDIYQDPLATPEIIADAIKDSGGIDSDTFRREYLNLQIRERGLVVLPDYEDALDCVMFDLPLRINLDVFMDWGGVKDKTVALLVGYDYFRNRDLYIDELSWDPNTPTSKIVGDLKPWMAKWEEQAKNPVKSRKMDAPGQLLVDLRIDYDLDVTLPPKDEWKVMVNQLNVAYAERRAWVHPRCELLRLTCRSGRLNKQKTDFVRTKALGHCDAIAAQMYANRGMDRSSPYPASIVSPDHVFMLPKQQTNVPQSILPKSFSGKGMKSFGSFKR